MVRRSLRRYQGLHVQVEHAGLDALFHLDSREEDEEFTLRARRLQRFLTRSFPGLELFAGTPGVYVPLTETVRGCHAILSGRYDKVPEEAFHFKATLDRMVTDSGV